MIESNTKRPRRRIDLHTHTTRSDGNDTPAELLDHAAKLGMLVVAVTDHDVLPPETVSWNGRELSLGEYAEKLGLGVLPGIEVSSDTFVDDAHIVGFGCDWRSEAIQWLPRMAVESKITGYRQLVDRLRQNGFELYWEELTGDGRRTDDTVQKKHVFELLAKKGYAETWQAAKIMVRDNPEYDVKREKPCPIETIRSLHEAGGVAILAHPYLIDETVMVDGKKTTRDRYIRRLIDAGLDGIETSYTYDKTSYKGTMSPEEIRREVIDRYGHVVSILSGGSDYHADGKKGVANPRRIGDAGVDVDYFFSHPLLPGLCEGASKEAPTLMKQHTNRF